MALVQCPECRRSVSDQAKICPQCAHPLKAPSHHWRTLGRAIIGGTVGLGLWWWVSSSSLGSPVQVGQDAIVVSAHGGNASLADDPAGLDRLLSAQRAGGSFTGLEAMTKFSVVPVTPGTRVHVLQLGFAGPVKAARIQVLGDQASQVSLWRSTISGQDLSKSTALITTLLTPPEGWTVAEWLEPAPPALATTPAPFKR